jgi:membrane protein
MMGLMRSFNKKNIGFGWRPGIHKRWIAIKLIIIIFALLLAYLILLISQGALLLWLIKDPVWIQVISYTRWIFIILLVYFIIGFIYQYAPAVNTRWKFNNPGTILATCLSILASFIFSTYVDNFSRYNALYGSIGTLIMVMALIFVNSLALLIGFELNVSITALKHIANDRKNREAEEALQQRALQEKGNRLKS